jgi:hypothetical protein
MMKARSAQEAIERGSGEDFRNQRLWGTNPPAGPHAKDGLTDHDKTPGTGSLPDKDDKATDAGTG